MTLRFRLRLSPRTILVAGGAGSALLAALIYLYFVFGANSKVIEIVPSLTRQPERCLTCHNGIESISASHPTDKFGCVSCHGGNALALDPAAAHVGVVRNPGDLSVSDKYCGGCHASQAATVPHSIMATYAGAIALVRRAFGLQSDGTAHFATTQIGALQAFSTNASDPMPVQHFSQNCLTCHLRTEPIQAPYFYRSTGCSSCHVLYSNDGLYQGGDPTIPKNQPGHASLHEITKQIPYTQCNHCHNRGNYDLRTMTFVPRSDIPAPQDLSTARQRWHDYYQPISQFTKCEFELDCIDCHTKTENMGDGVLHNNRAEAQYIQCQTCHGTKDSLPASVPYQQALPTATPLASFGPAPSAVLETQRGELMPQVVLVNGKWVLTTKASGLSYVVPMVKGSQCQQQPDQQSSQYCHQCHNFGRENFSALPTATP